MICVFEPSTCNYTVYMYMYLHSHKKKLSLVLLLMSVSCLIKIFCLVLNYYSGKGRPVKVRKIKKFPCLHSEHKNNFTGSINLRTLQMCPHQRGVLYKGGSVCISWELQMCYQQYHNRFHCISQELSIHCICGDFLIENGKFMFFPQKLSNHCICVFSNQESSIQYLYRTICLIGIANSIHCICVFFFVGVVNSTLKTVEQRGQHHWKSRLFPLYGHVCRTVLCGSDNGFLDQMVPHSQSHSHRVSDGLLFGCFQCISRDSVRQRQKNFYAKYLIK